MPEKPENLSPRAIGLAAVGAAIREGWRQMRACLLPALAFAALFAALGVLLLGLLLRFGLAPMIVPFAGGFLLLGPALLVGFFALRRASAAGRRPGPADVLGAFRQAPRGLWVISAVGALLFLIWISDAATAYSFMIGDSGAPALGQLLRFHAFTGVVGAVLALIVFCVSAFSVPLLFDRRATLVAAVSASVRAVFVNPAAMLAWGLILALTLITTILCPPLLLLSLPCLAFASDLLYLEVFPPREGSSAPTQE